MSKSRRVERPLKNAEYEIRFASTQARRGWTDLQATMRNALVDSWDFLTRSPLETTPTNYRLKDVLGTVMRGGESHERWQHKPTRQGDARIWFYVVGRVVYLEQVHTHHPNATK
ncbi:hypothetical protein [Gulosibacter sp. 10]|uniref:hypothetical protein n=1 Tax=Gulosibacter sp. 10 TaxID=1255570 RepID=UPI00097EF8AE|nr:hypothetical protein [Gulosibacter sp. 10]SJM47982.1 hypothetical protein FM112_00375 [Gulosibacter sp. 10]